MKIIYFICSILIVLNVGCSQRNDKTKRIKTNVNGVVIPQRLIADIPLGKNNKPVLSYFKNRVIVEKLNLDELERGFDSMAIRIRLSFTAGHGYIVVLKNISQRWTGDLIKFSYSLDDNGDSIQMVKATYKQKRPKSGWEELVKQLIELDILTLPNMSGVTNGVSIAHSGSYTVEYATKTNYRYYQYQDPEHFLKQIKSAKYMNEILQLLENEIGFSRYDLE